MCVNEKLVAWVQAAGSTRGTRASWMRTVLLPSPAASRSSSTVAERRFLPSRSVRCFSATKCLTHLHCCPLVCHLSDATMSPRNHLATGRSGIVWQLSSQTCTSARRIYLSTSNAHERSDMITWGCTNGTVCRECEKLSAGGWRAAVAP